MAVDGFPRLDDAEHVRTAMRSVLAPYDTRQNRYGDWVVTELLPGWETADVIMGGRTESEYGPAGANRRGGLAAAEAGRMNSAHTSGLMFGLGSTPSAAAIAHVLHLAELPVTAAQADVIAVLVCDALEVAVTEAHEWGPRVIEMLADHLDGDMTWLVEAIRTGAALGR